MRRLTWFRLLSPLISVIVGAYWLTGSEVVRIHPSKLRAHAGQTVKARISLPWAVVGTAPLLIANNRPVARVEHRLIDVVRPARSDGLTRYTIRSGKKRFGLSDRGEIIIRRSPELASTRRVVYKLSWPRWTLGRSWVTVGAAWIFCLVVTTWSRGHRALLQGAAVLKTAHIRERLFGGALLIYGAGLHFRSTSWQPWVLCAACLALALGPPSRPRAGNTWLVGLGMWSALLALKPLGGGGSASKAVVLLLFVLLAVLLTSAHPTRAVRSQWLETFFFGLTVTTAAAVFWRGGHLLGTADKPDSWVLKFSGQWLLAVFWAWLAAAAFSGKGSIPVRRACGLALVVAMALIWGSTKTSLLALGLSWIALLATLRWRSTARRLVFGAAVLGVVLAPWLLPLFWTASLIWPDLITSQPAAVAELPVRGGFWSVASELARMRPIGWGPGAAADLFRDGALLSQVLEPEASSLRKAMANYGLFPGGHPHNSAALIWLDLGVPGALLFAGLIASLSGTLGRLQENSATSAPMVAAFVSVAASCTYNYDLWEPRVLMFLVMSVTCFLPLTCQAVSTRFRRVELAGAASCVLAGLVLVSSLHLRRTAEVKAARVNPPALELDTTATMTLDGAVLRPHSRPPWQIEWEFTTDGPAFLYARRADRGLTTPAALVYVDRKLHALLWQNARTPQSSSLTAAVEAGAFSRVLIDADPYSSEILLVDRTAGTVFTISPATP